MSKRAIVAVSLTSWVGACAVHHDVTPKPSDVEITHLVAEDVPADVRATAEAALPGFVLSEAQKKVREGRVYFDVEGETPDGEEIEFDILMTDKGPEIVETQQDIDWVDAPSVVQSAAQKVKADISPQRVIESLQSDGVVIYELFTKADDAEPSMEVRFVEGVADVLKDRWPH